MVGKTTFIFLNLGKGKEKVSRKLTFLLSTEWTLNVTDTCCVVSSVLCVTLAACCLHFPIAGRACLHFLYSNFRVHWRGMPAHPMYFVPFMVNLFPPFLSKISIYRSIYLEFLLMVSYFHEEWSIFCQCFFSICYQSPYCLELILFKVKGCPKLRNWR